MQTTTDKTFDLDNLVLQSGAHSTRNDGVCLLEAVAWMAGEPHSDMPACASNVLGAYGRALNDAMPNNEIRDLLKPLVPKLVNTTAPRDVELRRMFVLVDRAVRVHAAEAIELRGFKEQADRLRALPPVTNAQGAELSRDCAREVGAFLWERWRAAVAARVAARVAAAAAADAAAVAARAADAAAVAAAARAAAARAARAAAAAAAEPGIVLVPRADWWLPAVETFELALAVR